MRDVYFGIWCLVGAFMGSGYYFVLALKNYNKVKNDKNLGDLAPFKQNRPGLYNMVNFIKYVYSDENNDREEILRYKDAVRTMVIYLCIALFTAMVSFTYSAILYIRNIP